MKIALAKDRFYYIQDLIVGLYILEIERNSS